MLIPELRSLVLLSFFRNSRVPLDGFDPPFLLTRAGGGNVRHPDYVEPDTSGGGGDGGTFFFVSHRPI